MNTSSHEKLAIQRHIQSDEENCLMQIHGLETAQGNLTAYLETGKGSDTILNKLQQNETTLKTLQQQLVYKKTEIPAVDAPAPVGFFLLFMRIDDIISKGEYA